jgi:hypothetical protein
MSETFIKPEDYLVQSALKVLKTYRSDARDYVPNLLRAAALPNNSATAAWSGDIYHRVGEWMARHGELERPIEYFETSLGKYHPSEALGPARVYRDFGMLRISLGQHDEAFDLLASADWYHQRDRKNDKGERQRRVTRAYVLEARVLSDDRSSALDELIDTALFARPIGSRRLRAFVCPWGRQTSAARPAIADQCPAASRRGHRYVDGPGGYRQGASIRRSCDRFAATKGVATAPSLVTGLSPLQVF